MKCLDLTLPTPAENLACDEALLEACEENSGEEVLRFWEPREYFVVVGYSNKVAQEVDLAACQAENVKVYRRCSGGGTVLQGPGCLNYSLILKIEGEPSLQTITGANCHIMGRQRDALSSRVDGAVRVQGHTDLSLDELKFSGNAQRRKHRALLFHGTFLLHFNLAWMGRFLPMPSRQPDYRRGRSHEQFVTNLPVSADVVKDALRRAWSVEAALEVVPNFATLLAEKYWREDWNLKF
ncbi:MAG TPA: lipoate--protein ligase family protein [Candidatus Saccharimonadales bacterium]|nr:lipoate--protein ligase family protein [Candidatus Saccharimonadales bacterium]